MRTAVSRAKCRNCPPVVVAVIFTYFPVFTTWQMLESDWTSIAVARIHRVGSSDPNVEGPFTDSIPSEIIDVGQKLRQLTLSKCFYHEYCLFVIFRHKTHLQEICVKSY